MLNSSLIIDRIKKSIFIKNEEPINIHEPCFTSSSTYEYVKECIDTGWVSSSGKWVSKFEDYIADFTGSKYAIAVSNGTVALRLALYLIGVRANDEVLVPPLSFVATANAISHLGATPHFVDIEPESLGMCPLALEKRLNHIAVFRNGLIFNKFSGKKISAVVPVHVFGLPAKIKELKKVCLKWNLPLVEDSAEALGSKVNTANDSIHCGCFGEIGILSFNGNKIITTGGGGALLTNNDKFAEYAKHLSTTAKVEHPWDFYHDQVAWNDRLPNINAAIGCAQFQELNLKLKIKRILHSRFVKSFHDIEETEIINESENCKSNYWLITLRLKGENIESLRKDILLEAHKLKIFLRPSWILLNKLPMYEKCYRGDLIEAENQSKRLINLPSSPQLLKNI